MLEPHGRALLFDILKPPADHVLDVAIATTYTLDLLALLTAPVAFSLFDVDNHEKLLDQDSLTLLESLRRYADKMTVFCHAGQIGLPKARFPQFEFLEHCIVECLPQLRAAAFHPKIWVLRFAGPDSRITYRLACLSRNLTFDRCWDTVLTLEGPLLDRQRAIGANHPLGDFIAALPNRAERALAESVKSRVAMIEAEVRRVQFEVPDGFEDYAFHPIGIDSRRLPFETREGRMLVVSPFISDGGLQRIAKGRTGSRLVSRPESLEQPNCRLGGFEKYYVMSSETADEPADEANSNDLDLTRGLHAKCYVIDSGRHAHVFTGSANATEAAFSGNVEFLVELVAPKSKCGIDALFERHDERSCLGDLLEEFVPQPKLQDEDAEAFRATVERLRQLLVAARFSSSVASKEDGFTLTVRPSAGLGVWAQNVHILCWPVTCGRGYGMPLSADSADVSFERLSLEALTAFIAFEVTVGEPARTDAFVLKVPLSGAPEDRRERLLRSFIKDRQRLMRFLLFLLADDAELADAMNEKRSRVNGQKNGDVDSSVSGLMESLLRTLHKSPERLDAVARLVADVRRDPEGAALLPPDFDRIWPPIWAAREKANR